MKNISFERRVYEPVDDSSLSYAISWKSMAKGIWSLKG